MQLERNVKKISRFYSHNCVDFGSIGLAILNCIAERKWCRPVSTDRISAEIAQLGERQTEDLKFPGSIPDFGNTVHYG